MSVVSTVEVTAEELLSVLQIIQKITGTGGPAAAEALAAANAALNSLISGLQNSNSPATILADVGAIADALQIDDSNADATPFGTKGA